MMKLTPREYGRKGGQATRGESKGSAKLTEDDVRMIRSSCEPASHLAKLLGIGETTARYVRIGKTWRHVQ